MKRGNIILIISIVIFLAFITFVIVKYLNKDDNSDKNDEQLQDDAVNVVNTGTTGTNEPPPPVDPTINVGDRIVATKDMLAWTDNNISLANAIHRFKAGEYVGEVQSIGASGYVVDNFSYKCTSEDKTYNYDATKAPFYCKRRPTRLYFLKAYSKKA